jgi:multiple sugar transport system permease protein
MLGKDVAHRGGRSAGEQRQFRQYAWELLAAVCSPETADEDIQRLVASGQARFVNPLDLKRLGLTDYLNVIPAENMRVWNDLQAGRIRLVIEPFMGKWNQFRGFLRRDAIDPVLRQGGQTFDLAAALNNLDREANTGTMFARPRATLDCYRPVARAIAVAVAVVLGLFTWIIIRTPRPSAGSHASVHRGWTPWIMLVPALITIAVWGYYPLLLGLIMAFQDYKIVGASAFVGLDNFISMALNPDFSHYIWTSLRFVLWNFGLAFFTPIALALTLAEIPRLKVFFRTLFFLPQMTSGIVVSLLWLTMFDAGPQGTLNRVLRLLFGWAGFTSLDWLGNPRTVMACVILPVVWAGAGIGSLIYLAALKSIPEELYDAASVDGAGIWRRLRHITLPVIAPLILISFVGTFIATFQAMANILLLTAGGPGKETMVMALAIWEEAYVNLRFSVATSYAWILGAMLIGATYVQMRLLRRVEFRAATEN